MANKTKPILTGVCSSCQSVRPVDHVTGEYVMADHQINDTWGGRCEGTGTTPQVVFQDGVEMEFNDPDYHVGAYED